MTLLERVEANVRGHKLRRAGETLLVGVSGGVDSMVLLHLLHELGIPLTIAHFNHNLRGAASDRDAQLVRKTAHQLNLKYIDGAGDVRGEAKASRASIEMTGRRLRHQFFANNCVKMKLKTVAVGHHADDQVELFFLRLLRGTSIEGVAGMRWSNPSPANPKIRIVRPFLNITKEELLDYAKSRRLNYREDATNRSNDFLRNRIRNELIPHLAKEFQPALATNVLRLMDIAGAESDVLKEMADKPLQSFDKLPVALQRRILSRQIIEHAISPSYDLIERLLATDGQWIEVEERTYLRRANTGMVQLRKMGSAIVTPGPHPLKLTPRGAATFSGVKVSWKIADIAKTRRAPHPPETERYDARRVGDSIWLRHWQPGDRFQPIGMQSPKKLQDLFTDLKVPRDERHQRLIGATAGGEIFWVEGLRMAEKFKLTDATAKQLIWSWSRPANGALS